MNDRAREEECAKEAAEEILPLWNKDEAFFATKKKHTNYVLVL